MTNNSISLVKSSTLKELSSDDEASVAHITTELVDEYIKVESPPEADAEAAVASVFYGHDMAYVFSERYQEYGYAYRGSSNSRERSCANVKGWFLPHSKWNHDKVGDCGSNNALLRFTRR